MSTDDTSPQAIAAAQTAVIRDALYSIGGRAVTPEELSELVDLPVEVIKRRLNAAGPGTLLEAHRRFAKSGAKWVLTAAGWREAEHAMRGK